MCNYCDDTKKIVTQCSKCWGMGSKPDNDSVYAWRCDRCNGEGMLEIDCIYCEE